MSRPEAKLVPPINQIAYRHKEDRRFLAALRNRDPMTQARFLQEAFGGPVPARHEYVAVALSEMLGISRKVKLISPARLLAEIARGGYQGTIDRLVERMMRSPMTLSSPSAPDYAMLMQITRMAEKVGGLDYDAWFRLLTRWKQLQVRLGFAQEYLSACGLLSEPPVDQVQVKKREAEGE